MAASPPCGAKLRQEREDGRTTCANAAGANTEHLGFGRCWIHGGRAPAGRKAAQRQQAEAIMKTYGIDNPIPTDPVEGLLQEIGRTAGHIQWLGLQIADLEAVDLIAGEKSFTVSTGHESGTRSLSGFGVHPYLELYREERKHFAAVCAKAVAAGIAERQIQIAESQGQMVGKMLALILDGLELTEKQTRLVPGLVERHLSLVG